jgi:hypothetical protein
MTTKAKGNGREGRRPTLNTEGSGTRNDNCNRQEGSFAALRMTADFLGAKTPPTIRFFLARPTNDLRLQMFPLG